MIKPIEKNKKRFIAIEGPIGVGKTTLAKKISSSYPSELLLEKTDTNPYLEEFYKNSKTAALPAQLHFLFHRTKQLKQLSTTGKHHKTCIADFLIDKDQIFAKVILNDTDLTLYKEVYKNLTFDAPKPDLVIYLQASVNILHKRIQQRKIGMESAITGQYLSQLSAAYADFFHYYESSPLLIVNTSGIDLIHNEDHFEQLLTQINSTTNGRNYFNSTVI